MSDPKEMPICLICPKTDPGSDLYQFCPGDCPRCRLCHEMVTRGFVLVDDITARPLMEAAGNAGTPRGEAAWRPAR
jgi:hypothetical protein